ncbi:MAG: hypothetical protein V1885_00705 [Candidatus Brennerbacteria bacterium]
MKNPLARNPFFYVSIVFSLALGFQVYGIVSAQTNWVGPTDVPPTANVAQPLNTGVSLQYKLGSFGVGNGNENLLLKAASGVRELFFTEGANNAAIKLDGTTGKLMFRNAGEGFKELGSGGAFWQTVSDGIKYDGETARAKNLVAESVVTKIDTTYAYIYSGTIVGPSSSSDHPQGWTPRLLCDGGVIQTSECPDVYSDNVTASSPNVAYDNYLARVCTGNLIGNYQCGSKYYAKVYNKITSPAVTYVTGGVIKGRVMSYPWTGGRRTVCVDDTASVRLVNDGTRAYLELGGRGPGGEWMNNCSYSPAIKTPTWKWENVSNGAMKICVEYDNDGIGFWTTCKYVTIGDQSNENFMSYQIDATEGERDIWVTWSLEGAPFAFSSYEP